MPSAQPDLRPFSASPTAIDGLHIIEADQPIAVIVSGFQNYIDYGHPGAMHAF